MKLNFEVTDTFGGEANYSWVKRASIDWDGVEYSRLKLVRRLKKFAGFTGMKCVVEDFGDMLVVTPADLCQVAFATYSNGD